MWRNSQRYNCLSSVSIFSTTNTLPVDRSVTEEFCVPTESPFIASQMSSKNKTPALKKTQTNPVASLPLHHRHHRHLPPSPLSLPAELFWSHFPERMHRLGLLCDVIQSVRCRTPVTLKQRSPSSTRGLSRKTVEEFRTEQQKSCTEQQTKSISAQLSKRVSCKHFGSVITRTDSSSSRRSSCRLAS